MTYKNSKAQKSIDNYMNTLNELPPFLHPCFKSMAISKAPRTIDLYSTEILCFLTYIKGAVKRLNRKAIIDITLKDIETLKEDVIESYLLQYSSSYHRLKLTIIRTVLHYYEKRKQLEKNPTRFLNRPKTTSKPIVTLTDDECIDLLNYIETGCDSMTEKQRKAHELTKHRDLVIVSLLLTTGIRMSELVGLDVKDLCLEENTITITRKGDNKEVLYLHDDVVEPLKQYLELDRQNVKPLADHKEALFVSLLRTRLTGESVNRLIKKYCAKITDKKISAHKLRSTYATRLYRNTRDIALVSTMVGHSNINTTMRYYADVRSDIKQAVTSIASLRGESA